jgi:transcriptional regulator with XRE-family HTH domain
MATPPGVLRPTELRKRRLAAGLTQQQLAERVGCLQPHISAMENGRRRISHSRWERMETVLDEATAARGVAS